MPIIMIIIAIILFGILASVNPSFAEGMISHGKDFLESDLLTWMYIGFVALFILWAIGYAAAFLRKL